MGLELHRRTKVTVKKNKEVVTVGLADTTDAVKGTVYDNNQVAELEVLLS